MLGRDELQRRVDHLDLGRYDHIQTVQGWLDQHYPSQARCRSLHQGVLKIVTPVATVASDLRLRQVEIMALISQEPITRVQVVVGTLSVT